VTLDHEAPDGDGSSPVRDGFIGLGMMGREHVANVLALPGAVAVAGVDPHLPSRQATSALAGDDFVLHDDVESMLVADDIDAVVISTPNHTHRDVLDGLWGRELHLLVEKPLATTIEDCVHVAAAAADHPGVVQMGLEYRFMPPVAQFLETVAGGATGEVRTMSVREHRFPFLTKVGDWNRFTANTGGTLVEKCCHFFDLMNLVMPGVPERVMASGGQAVNHLEERYGGVAPDVLDHAFVIVDYSRGGRAALDLCMFAEGSRWEQELVVVGDAGKVEAHLPNFMELARGRRSELVVGSRAEGWPVTEQHSDTGPPVGYAGAHHGASYLEHVAFVAAIRQGGPPAVTLEEGVRSVAVGVAAHRSIDEGRPVHLDELGIPPATS
jgi:myo-inositol 2-dehydrogenase / D-chiro-inositol 1-dehydrogenase